MNQVSQDIILGDDFFPVMPADYGKFMVISLGCGSNRNRRYCAKAAAKWGIFSWLLKQGRQRSHHRHVQLRQRRHGRHQPLRPLQGTALQPELPAYSGMHAHAGHELHLHKYNFQFFFYSY